VIDRIEYLASMYLEGNAINQNQTEWYTDAFNIKVGISSPKAVYSLNFTLPAVNLNTTSKINLPNNLLKYLDADTAVASRMIDFGFKDYRLVNTSVLNSSEVEGSQTVSFELENVGRVNYTGQVNFTENAEALAFGNLTEPVSIKVPVRILNVNATASCTYLNETGDYWSTSGCKYKRSEMNAVICQCTHLSIFSVQDSSEGLTEAYGSANIKEATNFESITDLNFGRKAAGLYTALSILFLYILLGVVLNCLDKHDLKQLETFKTSQQQRLKMVLNRHKNLFPQLVKLARHNSLGNITSNEVPTDNPGSRLDSVPKIKILGLEKSILMTTECQDDIESNPTGRKVKRRDSTDVGSVNIKGLTNLINFGVDTQIIPDIKVDIERFAPDPKFYYRVYQVCVIEKQKSKWEIFVTSHKLAYMIFFVDENYSRFARLTVFVTALLGQLFISGLFFNNDDSAKESEETSMLDALTDFSWFDFWVAVVSALLCLPIYLLVKLFFDKAKGNPASLAPENVEITVKRRMRCKVMAYGLSWSFMAFCMYEITIFAIQFNSEANFHWLFSFTTSTIYDLLIQGNLLFLFILIKSSCKRAKPTVLPS